MPELGGHWVTIHGDHIFIREGQSIAEAFAERFAKEPIRYEPSERMKRAIAAYKPANKEEQEIADEQERKLSSAIGLPRTRDNSAFDLRNEKVGVELKTMIKSENGKITMSKAALARKMAEIKRSGRGFKAYTVVADKRAGGTKYFLKEGVGSFRVSSMKPVTLSELKEHLK